MQTYNVAFDFDHNKEKCVKIEIRNVSLELKNNTISTVSIFELFYLSNRSRNVVFAKEDRLVSME